MVRLSTGYWECPSPRFFVCYHEWIMAMRNGTDGKLTAKQQRFVEENLVSLNTTDAVCEAGRKGNDGTLQSVGSENLRKPVVTNAMAKRQWAMATKADITVDKVLEEFWQTAMACLHPTNVELLRPS